MRLSVVLAAFVLVGMAIAAQPAAATPPSCDPDHPCDPPPHPVDPLDCRAPIPPGWKGMLLWVVHCATM